MVSVTLIYVAIHIHLTFQDVGSEVGDVVIREYMQNIAGWEVCCALYS